MKYYIDFEASEGLEKIISIGCVKENGEEYYSLVNTGDPITPKIERITSITQQQLNEAKSSKEVFEEFYDWCNKDNNLPEFICYGDGDFTFVYNTFLDATSLKEASILGYIYTNMEDVSQEMKEHFYVNKTISLEKLGKHFIEDMDSQNHNALDDAKLLKTVYEAMQNKEIEVNIFKEYLDSSGYHATINKIVMLNGDKIIKEFSSIAEAIKWVESQPNDKGPSYKQNIDEKIERAAKDGGKYFGGNWRIL